MIGGNPYQHLTFNPRRQGRTEKQPRQGLQIKIRPNQQYLQPEPLYQGFTSKNNQARQGIVEGRYLQQPFQKDKSYEHELSSRKGELEDLKRRETERKKEDMLQRVKKLQNIVLPLVERDHEEEDLSEFGWQAKIERKMLRIESCLDNVRKEWQIQMQKRVIMLQDQLEARYRQLLYRKQ